MEEEDGQGEGEEEGEAELWGVLVELAQSLPLPSLCPG